MHLHAKSRTNFLVVVALLLTLLGVGSANAATEIDLTGGRITPLPIAVTGFLPGGGAEEAAATISGVISNDLGRSGYFNPLPPESFIEQISNFSQEPRFADWRQIQAKALVTGQVFMEGGKLRAEFRLWDVESRRRPPLPRFDPDAVEDVPDPLPGDAP